MSATGSTPNFLLQVTLPRTSDPVVTRIISVPPDDDFEGLQEASAAAIEWSEEETSNGIDRLDTSVVLGNPSEAKRPKEIKIIFYRMNKGNGRAEDGDGDGIWTSSLTKIEQVFDDFRFREKPIVYDYHHGFVPAVRFLVRSSYSADGRALCLGGRGEVTGEARAEGRTADYADASGGQSSWEVDLEKIRARVERLNVDYSGSTFRISKERKRAAVW